MVIKSASFNHSSIPPTETATVRDTATAFVYPIGGSFRRMDKGAMIDSTHMIYMNESITCDVGNRIYSGSSTNYYEVLRVDIHEGHKEAEVKKVRGR